MGTHRKEATWHITVWLAPWGEAVDPLGCKDTGLFTHQHLRATREGTREDASSQPSEGCAAGALQKGSCPVPHTHTQPGPGQRQHLSGAAPWFTIPYPLLPSPAFPSLSVTIPG
jgi:hypothetical protein